jgi:DNA-binding PadR family transcriptional regulator
MAIREGLLALLHDGPRHGYQLKTEFEAATGGVWPLNVGQVYTTLDRLERDGLVHMHTANGSGTAGGDTGSAAQRTYALTPAGEAELKAWFTTTAPEGPPPRDELMLKVLMEAESVGPRRILFEVLGGMPEIYPIVLPYLLLKSEHLGDQRV